MNFRENKPQEAAQFLGLCKMLDKETDFLNTILYGEDY